MDYLETLIRRLDSAPIVMGHSFGGLFAQLLVYGGLARAAVGIGPGTPAGVLEHTISREASAGLYDRYAVPCTNRVLFENFEQIADCALEWVLEPKVSRPQDESS